MSDFGITILGKHVVSDRLTRYIGQTTINAPGSVTLEGDGRPFAYAQMQSLAGAVNAPQITINGMTVSWTYNGFPATLCYGLY